MNCHYKWETEPYLIYKGYSHCPLESHQVQHTTQWLEEQMALTAGIEYSLLGEYKTINTLVLIKHNVCGKTFKMTPKAFLNMGQRCPYEARERASLKNLTPLETIKKRIKVATKSTYEIADDTTYSGVRHPCLIRHKKCGLVWSVPPYRIYSRSGGCPKCNESKGEIEVRKYLETHHYTFKAQHKIEKCRDKKPLPFDFAIFNKDGSLNCLIEYQGVQHFIPTFFTQDDATVWKHDKMKLNFCRKNNIELIAIPYASKRSNVKQIRKIVKTYLDKYLHVNPEPSFSEN